MDGFEETYGQKTKNIGNQKNANLSKSWYLTFFDDEISKLFFHSYGPRIPKWNFAHHLWSKQAQNIRKTPQNTWFTDPCFISLQTGHPVYRSNLELYGSTSKKKVGIFQLLRVEETISIFLWCWMWNRFFENPILRYFKIRKCRFTGLIGTIWFQVGTI